MKHRKIIPLFNVVRLIIQIIDLFQCYQSLVNFFEKIVLNQLQTYFSENINLHKKQLLF